MIVRFRFFIGVALFAACVGAIQAKDILAEDFAALSKAERVPLEPEAKVPELQRLFRVIVSKTDRATFAKLSDNDAKDYFESASIVSFYSNDEASTARMRSGLDELERRHFATAKSRQDMLDYYVAARMFEPARLYAAAQLPSKLRPIPKYRDEAGDKSMRTTLKLSADGHDLVRSNFTVDDSPHVIAVTSPWCHFTREASAAIDKDPQLSVLMKRYSTWLMPQTLVPDFAALAEWNEHHVDWPIVLPYHRADWPMITSWNTPTFYFFRHGRLVESVVGWPDDSQLERLRAALKSIEG